MSVAVLSPHLDDAVLSTWSALPARVVNVCTGLPPAGSVTTWDRVCGATDSRAHMEERLEEDAAALATLGVEPAGLGFLDSQYRTDPLDPAELTAAIRAAVDGASLLWVPAGIGAHADHLQVRDAAMQLGVPLRLYAELPYAVKFGWPAWVTDDEPDPALVPDAGWNLPDGVGDPTVHALTASEVQSKLQTLRLYRTQFSALSRGKLGHLADSRVAPYEVSWALPT